MVTSKSDDLGRSVLVQATHVFDDLARARAAVDVVAQENEGVPFVERRQA